MLTYQLPFHSARHKIPIICSAIGSSLCSADTNFIFTATGTRIPASPMSTHGCSAPLLWPPRGVPGLFCGPIGAYRGILSVHWDALICSKHELIVHCVSMQTYEDSHCPELVRLGRRARLRLSIFVHWHQIEVDIKRNDVLACHFVSIPS